MAKRKESGIDLVASLSWPTGVALGLIAFVGIQYGIGWLLGANANPFLSAFGKLASTGFYTPFAWFMLLACCLGALVSFLHRRKRRQLLESQTGMTSLRNMDWRTFETLVGEAFRRQGYTVEESGQGGADGGKDLLLRKGGLTTIVQCKQWRSQRVPVQVVREMFGVLIHERASAVKIVTLCGYTPEAAAFARDKPIELIDGRALLSTVKTIQATREPEGPLDNPLLFAGSVLASALVAFALPAPQTQHPTEPFGSATPPAVSSRSPAATAPMAAMAPPALTPIAIPAAARPAPNVYKADPPMSDQELREWQKRNREAMKILEKTTPELETAPAN
ncbi:restriction endonuclease [Dyella japonica]|uniref:Restriction system protein n=1 Tax=Dyella japonica TaxID=231455 RepID=A0ABV2JVS2_9GAMM